MGHNRGSCVVFPPQPAQAEADTKDQDTGGRQYILKMDRSEEYRRRPQAKDRLKRAPEGDLLTDGSGEGNQEGDGHGRDAGVDLLAYHVLLLVNVLRGQCLPRDTDGKGDGVQHKGHARRRE